MEERKFTKTQKAQITINLITIAIALYALFF